MKEFSLTDDENICNPLQKKHSTNRLFTWKLQESERAETENLARLKRNSGESTGRGGRKLRSQFAAIERSDVCG